MDSKLGSRTVFDELGKTKQILACLRFLSKCASEDIWIIFSYFVPSSSTVTRLCRSESIILGCNIYDKLLKGKIIFSLDLSELQKHHTRHSSPIFSFFSFPASYYKAFFVMLIVNIFGLNHLPCYALLVLYFMSSK